MRNKFCIDNLLLKDNLKTLDIQRWQFLEELFNLAFKIFVIIVAFYIWDYIIVKFISLTGKEGFDSTFLYSFIIIPILYSISNSYMAFRACFIRAYVSDDIVICKEGFITTKIDNLYLKDVNNIEIHRTFLGKFFGYCEIILYAPGGAVNISYIKDNETNYKTLKTIVDIVENNQKNSDEK